MKKIILIIAFNVFYFTLSASPQRPDYIIYKNDTVATYNLILEQYFQSKDTLAEEKLFGLNFRDGATFNCWRGYQAIYKIENDSLFLTDIIECGERLRGKLNKSLSNKKMATIFGDKLRSSKVYIDWFSGDLNFPLNNKVLRWDGVFYTIYEKETIVNISSGRVLNIENIENYIDDPKSIDRRDKSKISDILFEKLKNNNWKKADDCDCSEKYFVTINESGKISKVTMIGYETDEKIDENWERNEYNYCIRTIFKTLKKLKFDIIKYKGKPTSEDIYIKIWTKDDGEIENWTR